MSNIVFFIGTTAELIKMYPVMQEMDSRSLAYKVVASGQNVLDDNIIRSSGIRKVDLFLSSRSIKQSTFGLLIWFLKTFIIGFFKMRKEIKVSANDTNIFLVHGDTISTVMGAALGRILGFDVHHVEAGLRSFNWMKPFPEELDRVIVSKLSHVHYCPNDWAAKNLMNRSGVVINTQENTLLDSLNFALRTASSPNLLQSINGKFFIFVLHRQENLFNSELVTRLIKKIIEISNSELKCLMIMHSPTKACLSSLGLIDEINSCENIVTTARMNYFEFMKVMDRCEFVVTDGGSNQEECYYFGKPCLILRTETERNEGLGYNTVLSELNDAIIDDFLNNINRYKKPPIVTKNKPSKIIVDFIENEK
ncbi:UDP-N-acetylglucosamine 2-epimerase [Vibrio cholerae]|uniref:UDP-N-acetylglucosamine 2-epimerase n=1 Tax=Vibrio cholerae TaxID=666 RepID=UPI00053C72CC|nr:UDP-N-acetylglucosamine 2-epimerase [Vibrio cholerae]